MIFRTNITRSFINAFLRKVAAKGFSLKGFLLLTFLGSTSFFILAHYLLNLTPAEPVKTSFPREIVKCFSDQLHRNQPTNVHVNDEHRNLSGDKILIIAEFPYSTLLRGLVNVLESLRFKFKIAYLGKSLPQLSSKDKGIYNTVIFEKLESYLTLDLWNQQLISEYCVKYKVGIIAFAQTTQILSSAQVQSFPLFINTNVVIRKYQVNPQSPVLRVTKAGAVKFDTLTSTVKWSVFYSNHSTYEPISTSLPKGELGVQDCLLEYCEFAPVIRDKGALDGIQKVFFGLGFHFWLHKLLFVDVLSFISHGKLSIPLERNILVDIDDIFVGKPYTRMTRPDVWALVDAQKRMQVLVKDFRFNLGFSGKYFRHGTVDENEGDEAILKSRNEFWWFGHSWSHSQAHMLNLSSLIEDMELNRAFAKLHSIPVNLSYAVAPHHSGVFPVQEELYDAWKLVWNIKVTSTEEYPGLWPARHRRGFVHKDVKVLPRQTCGLYTHTIFFDEFPGGVSKLDGSIKGGELFQTILFNLVNIFMTHLSNYGNDRLALYTFENLFQFINCWTNLDLKTVEPTKMAEIYFEKYPNEVDPLWKNPCNNKRHIAIWSPAKSCSRFPNLIIIGPQKTGSTALSAYLSLHPSLVSNFHNTVTFEEVQFFVGDNYKKGIDWYMQQFPLLYNSSDNVLFEKSANYFTEGLAPLRIFTLLPKVKLICIIIDPSVRAYSWYQHVLSHGNPVAKQYSFRQVITANLSAHPELLELAHRCLLPGLYVRHIEKWFRHVDPQQLLILDGEKLRVDPIPTMDEVQDFIRVKYPLNYSTLIRYNSKKGFYCPYSGDKTKCLGSGKGRKYPAMDSFSKHYLSEYFHKPNLALYKLLKKYNYSIPHWLVRELNYSAR